MKGFALFIVLFLIFGLAVAICGAISAPRLENVAIYAIDSHVAAQQNPVNVLERQMDAMQANSPSNAPGFPWSLVFMLVGTILLTIAHQWERLMSAKTKMMEAATKLNRATKRSGNGAGQQPQLRPMTPVRPLNPYNFQPSPQPSAALPASSTDDNNEEYERW